MRHKFETIIIYLCYILDYIFIHLMFTLHLIYMLSHQKLTPETYTKHKMEVGKMMDTT